MSISKETKYADGVSGETQNAFPSMKPKACGMPGCMAT